MRRPPLKRRTALRATTELRSTTELAPGGPLRQVSKKMAAQRRQEVKLKVEILERDGGCVARDLATGIPCWGPLDKHELVKRSAWRKGALVEANVVILCRIHNQWVEDFPNAAREIGLARRSSARESHG